MRIQQIKLKKLLITGLLTMFIMVSLFLPKSASAQFIVTDPMQMISTIWDKVITPVWEMGGAFAYRTVINYFLKDVARQAGEWAATGFTGEKPLFVTDKKYWSKLGDDALGELITQYSEKITGRNLCDPFDPTIRFKMLVSMDPQYQKIKWDEQLHCSFSKIKQRMKEVQKQKLFDIEFGVRDGPVAGYKANIEILLSGDSALTKANDSRVCDPRGLFMAPSYCSPDSDSGHGLPFAENPFAMSVNQGVQYLLDIADNLSSIQDEFENIVLLFGLKPGDIESITKKRDTAIELLGGLETQKQTLLDNGHDSSSALVIQVNRKIYWKQQLITDLNQSLEAAWFKEFPQLAQDDLNNLKQRLKGEIWEPVPAGVDPERYSPADKTRLSWWKKFIPECASSSPVEFCDNCQEIFKLSRNSDAVCMTPDGDPTDEYTNALAYTNRANSYVRKLVDWANTLEQMIEQTKTSNEGFDIPDIDPLEDANKMMSPGRSDIGVIAELRSDLFKEQTIAVSESEYFQTLQGEMKAVTSRISDWTKTPAVYVEESTRKAVESAEDPASFGQYTGVAAADALTIFKKTLINSLLKRLQKGINPQVEPPRDKPFLLGEGGESGESVSPYTPGKEEAQALFAGLQTPAIKSGREITIYDEFLTCPSNQSYRSTMNCVTTEKLNRAIEEGISIADAVCWPNQDDCSPLIPSGILVGNPDDREGLMSLNNIKKLRRLRIMPLGLEIAAAKVYNRELPDTNVTLEHILNGFDQVNSVGTCTNLNGSFETDSDNNDIPDGWNPYEQTYSEVTLDPDYYIGSSAVKITQLENSDGVDNEWVAMRRDMPFKKDWVEPGDKVTLSFWYKGFIEESAYQYICYSAGYCGQGEGYPQLGFDAIPSDTYENWTRYESTQTVSQDMLTACLNNDNPSGNCLKQLAVGQMGYRNVPNENNLLIDGVQITKGPTASEEYKEPSLFCHLVNPNWILKASTYQCNAQGFSAAPISSGSAQRQETCVDLKDCIEENENGECLTWAYCTREKNIWRLDGDSCDEQYATCQTYTRSKDNKEVSYLSRTVDFGSCTEDNTGCKWYCTEFDQDKNDWSCTGPGTTFGYRDGDELDEDGNPIPIPVQDIEDEGNAIFFNNNIEYCSPEVQGCKEYIRTIDFDIKDQDGSFNLEALQSVYELNDKIYLANAPECEEQNAGCQLYTSSIDNLSVSGVVNIDDRCPAQCVGYETFQQMPSNFDTSTSFVNFIPETANMCSSPGCEEFTNLDAVAQGGEGLEYYSYLRQCAKLPDEADSCANFYTWIGSETAGYQLKRYQLKAVPQGQPGAGSPEIIDEITPPEWGKCNGASDALLNPHCKEFYSESGAKYYRLFKNTITCSQDCSPYRRSVSVDGLQYMTIPAIPGQGDVCSVSDTGCREYKGPTANNIQILFTNDFESGSVETWTGGEISSESVNYPGRSLKVLFDGEAIAYKNVEELINQDKSYLISFWAKGTLDGSDINIRFSSFDWQSSDMVLDADEWKEIKFAPFYFDNKPEEGEKLYIASNAEFYIDNIILKQVSDNIYAIKDSWFTPAICDQDFEDNDIVGEQLGCQLYTDQDNTPHYLKSFSQLCPESEVGCEALINTQNYSGEQDDNEDIFLDGFIFNNGNNNLEDGAKDDVTVAPDSIVYRINNQDYICPFEDKGCEKMGLPQLRQDNTVESYDTVYIKNNPDLYTAEPLLCSIEDLGCEAYEGSVYFKDPEVGNKICEYRENVIIGDKTRNGWFKKDTDQACYYNVDNSPYMIDAATYGIYSSDNENDYDGWAGACPSSVNSCTQYIDPGWAGTEIKNIIAYGDFADKQVDETDVGPFDWNNNLGSTFSSWSTKVFESELTGFENALRISVGPETDVSQDGFENNELSYDGAVLYSIWAKVNKGAILFGDVDNDKYISIDVTDSDGNWIQKSKIVNSPAKTQLHILTDGDFEGDAFEGDAYVTGLSMSPVPTTYYYYLDNDKFDTASCLGKVSLKQGCVLFNNPNISTSTFNSFATYKKSAQSFIPDALVSPISCENTLDCDETANTDSNYCLYCSPYGLTNNDTNTIINVRQDRVCGEWLSCTAFRSEWDKASGTYRTICDAVTRCDKLAGSGEESQCANFVYSEPQVLTEQVYQNRDISFYGMDYSGYSLYNMYPIEQLIPKDINDEYKLTFERGSLDTGVGGGGNDDTIDKWCRLYPEEDSPFKQLAKTEGGYSDVNVCKDSEDPECQCSYTKAEYAGTIRYYNTTSTPPSGICIGGSEDGDPCNPAIIDDCTGGICQKITQQINTFGQTGYCLEPDLSKEGSHINACITWWPGQTIGDPSIYQTFTGAGYKPATDRQWYCVEQVPENEKLVYSGIGGACYNDFGDDDNICHSDTIDIYSFFKQAIKFEFIEKIAVRIRADDGGDKCSSADCDTWVELKQSNDWTQGKDNDDQNNTECKTIDQWPGSAGVECGLARNGGTAVIVRACAESSDFSQGGCLNDDTDFFDHIQVVYQDESAQKATAGYNGIKVYIKDACKTIVNIADSGGFSKAYTNRVNSVNGEGNNYINQDETIDNKEISTLCKPWGALSLESGGLSGFSIIMKNDSLEGICPADKNEGVIYTNKDEVKNNLFAKTYQVMEFSQYSEPSNCTGNSPGECESSENACWDDWDCDIIEQGDCRYDEQDDRYFCYSGRVGECDGNDNDCDVYDTCSGEVYGECEYTGTQCTNDTVCVDPTSLKWQEQDNDTDGWNITENEDPPLSPQVADIKVGGHNSSDIDITAASYSAVLTFNAWAHADHMPVRQIIIDWLGIGLSLPDGTSNPLINNYLDMVAKNHMSVGECDNSSFGTSEDACVEEPWQFTRILTCAPNGLGWEEYGVQNACAFKPKIYIKDNWGWCNGTNDPYAGDELCTDSSVNGVPGTSFDYNIIIRPQQ